MEQRAVTRAPTGEHSDYPGMSTAAPTKPIGTARTLVEGDPDALLNGGTRHDAARPQATERLGATLTTHVLPGPFPTLTI
jgi:hypothetical protein